MENTRVLISAIGQTVVVNVHGFLLLYLPCSQTGLLVVLAFYILEWPKPSVLHGICLQSFCFVLVFFFLSTLCMEIMRGILENSWGS